MLGRGFICASTSVVFRGYDAGGACMRYLDVPALFPTPVVRLDDGGPSLVLAAAVVPPSGILGLGHEKMSRVLCAAV